MQKLINLLAVLSFVGTAGIIGAGYYVYSQRESLVEGAKEQAIDEIKKALPGMISGAMPSIPKVTGPSIPTGKTGLNIPSF
jgi:hypothetical protein